MIATYALAADLKKHIAGKFGVNLHFHDTCGGGMYFSLDARNDDIAEFIKQYFAAKNMKVSISESGLNFTVEDD
ncbi:MAG: hypothetical protein IJ770_02530 [Alphaproteobacteria bacterium]|nr:hypothetical protein [Alphaproteobacteria bacterium]